MISKEEARERLKAFYNPNHSTDQVSRLAQLSSSLSFLGQVLIQDGPAWKKLQKEMRSGNGRKFRLDYTQQLATLNLQERMALFTALFPGIASQVELTWNLFDLLPYQSDYQRRPFRIPHAPILESRITWLQRLPFAVHGYEHQDVRWLAIWAAHFSYWSSELGYLFAAAIEKGDDTGIEVFNILVASGNGTHEVGMMGRHVVRGLLCCSRVDGWDYIERMLLAAQREEGLRQVILEAIDEAHPQAFRRILRLMLDHNLIRFSAAIRALSVWLGLPFEAVNQKAAHEVLARVLQCLGSPAECEKAAKQGEAQDAYYALWAMAFDDASAAYGYAAELSHSASVEQRFAAIHLLGQLDLKQCFPVLLAALDDEDLRVSTQAFLGLISRNYDHHLRASSDMFERLERLLPRLKHKQNNLKPLVWDWLPIVLNREQVAGQFINCLGKRSPRRLIPYLSTMNPMDRAQVAQVLGESKQKEEETLQALLSLVSDRSQYVRETALKGLTGIKLRDSEVARLEDLYSRQSQDLRRGLTQLLLELPDEKLLESIRRLIVHRGEYQHFAALELLKECKQNQRAPEQVQALALEYQQRVTPSNSEKILLNEILSERTVKYSLEDALELLNPQNLTQPNPVKSTTSSKVKLGSSAAVACLKSLDALVEQHRNDVIEIEQRRTKTTELLGNIHGGWMLYPPNDTPGYDFSRFALKGICEAWWQTRTQDLCDPDGYELIRAYATTTFLHYTYAHFSRPKKGIAKELQTHFDIDVNFDLNYGEIVNAMVEWLMWAHPADGETEFVLDALEESVSRISHAELTGLREVHDGRKIRVLDERKISYLDVARWQRDNRFECWNDQHHARLWDVVQWLDHPEPHLTGEHATFEDALFAFQAGAATRDDLLYMFLGPQEDKWRWGHFQLLHQFSGRRLHVRAKPQFEEFPIIKGIVDACRERIIEVECKRGELPSAATGPARHIRTVPGMRNLIRLLVSLGDAEFERGYLHSESRSGTFSHLIRNSYPLESDTVDELVTQARLHGFSEKRLIELAVYAPQWAPFVEQTIGREHLADAVWWLYAHTKDRQWRVEDSIREEWAARISEHTPLSTDELMDGAVDVEWFHRIYAQLGEERWKQLYNAATYASGGTGHGRARLFADSMLGKLTTQQLQERIQKKRHQDSVRALGLAPLRNGKAQNEEILRRYEVMQELLWTGRKFGSQRRANEKLAVLVGMQNLARTAGYADPQRLEWAMEVAAVADLSAGPIRASVNEFQITLSINELGEPVLEFRKKDKLMKRLPSLIKKNEQVAELLDRKEQLDQQVSRTRLSLEQAMCRGDEFTVQELKTLFRHPMLRVMLEQLVFVSSQGLGYPIQQGEILFRHDGEEIALSNTARLRIAHPLDLLESNAWHLWQHECFVAERIQPFKQVFRELYILTSAEKGEGHLSRRYAGQQVNPRQAVALFGGQGWVIDPSEGVQKTFHQDGICARVGFLQGMFTPAEVEGSTIEAVAFTKRGEWSTLNLEQIPPRIFSEVMRDLDLVVSVAHAGGIDPESSASSIEARAALIRETATLLNLMNVQLSQQHVIIDGRLSNYNVNLGSGVVHRQPGGALCIIPVHSQHRGRIFLPFVDNDPKTAEIVSKVILLARDDQIKDPTILEQIV